MQTPTLSNSTLTLIPFNGNGDREYLLKLAKEYKYNTQTREEMINALDLSGHLFWTAWVGKDRVGVVWTSYVPGFGYSIDGYKEDGLCKKKYNRPAISSEGCRLVTEWMLNNVTPTMYAITPTKNRASRIMCKSLGYKFVKRINGSLGELYILEINKEDLQ